jgi:phage terminase large subunit
MIVEPDFIPRPQLEPYLWRKQRWSCMVLHRRAGKSFVCIQDLMLKALMHKRTDPPPRYAYLAPTRDQAKDIAWKYLSDFSAKIPQTEINKADLMVTLHNKATIRLYSGESFERLRGLYLDGIVIDEAQDVPAVAWDSVIRPALSDYNGWATFIGTPRGRNAFWQTWCRALKDPTWFTMIVKADDSGIIAPEELADIKRSTPANIYAQEFLCDFSVARSGAIYARLLEDARNAKRISDDILWHKEAPVFTAWDVGAPFNQRVWAFQVIGDRIVMLESLFGDHECGTPADWAKRLLSKQYSYGGHFIPHDAATSNGGLWQQALLTAGLRDVRPIPRQTSVWDGINLALEAFPRVSFNASGCAMGIDSLDNYHAKEETDGMTIKDVPVHDHASHAADAFSIAFQAIGQGMIVDRRNLPRRQIDPSRRQRLAVMR